MADTRSFQPAIHAQFSAVVDTMVAKMRQEVQWFLVEGLARIRAEPHPDEIEFRRSTLAWFGGELVALRYVEEISEEELQDWHQRLLVALGVALPSPGRPGATRAIWIGPGDPTLAQPLPPPPEFVRSWAGPNQEFALHEGRFRVIAVEQYDTAITVRWRAAPVPGIANLFPSEMAQFAEDVEGVDDWAEQELRSNAEGFLRFRRLFEFSLADDVGTEYFSAGAGSGGNGVVHTGEIEFRPAPPPEATNLTFKWHGLVIELPIP